MVAADKASRLRSLLKSDGASEIELDAVFEFPDDADESKQAELKRKVISLSRNVLRIVDSGNKVNKEGVATKVDVYIALVDSELREDPAQQGYVNLLYAIKGLL